MGTQYGTWDEGLLRAGNEVYGANINFALDVIIEKWTVIKNREGKLALTRNPEQTLADGISVDAWKRALNTNKLWKSPKAAAYALQVQLEKEKTEIANAMAAHKSSMDLRDSQISAVKAARQQLSGGAPSRVYALFMTDNNEDNDGMQGIFPSIEAAQAHADKLYEKDFHGDIHSAIIEEWTLGKPRSGDIVKEKPNADHDWETPQ